MDISVDEYFGVCDKLKRHTSRLCQADSICGHHKSLGQVSLGATWIALSEHPKPDKRLLVVFSRVALYCN
jgi:hypothetical protein